MLRNKSGEWTFYRVECQLGDKDHAGRDHKWFGIGDSQEALVPYSERWPSYGEIAEPWRSYSACGDLWQETGEHGVRDLALAVQIKERLERAVSEKPHEKFPDMRFRVTMVKVTQAITVVEAPVTMLVNA